MDQSTQLNHAKSNILTLKNSKILPIGTGSIAVKHKSSIDVIQTSEIHYVKAESNYSTIYLIDGTSYLTSQTLKKYDDHLPKSQFMRVHSGFLIQKKYIKSFSWKTNILRLTDKITIPVSRSKKAKLMEYLSSLAI